MAFESVLKARGLVTHPNELSQVPEGSLLVANNIVIDRDGVIEPRRGNEKSFEFSTILNTAKKMFVFQNNVLIHATDNKIYKFDNTTVTSFTGTFTQIDIDNKIRFETSNENLYFTTSTGIQKLDLIANEPVDSGTPKGLDAALTLSGISGFFTNSTQVAYRIVWSLIDSNNNTLLGAPSQRLIIGNGTGSSKNITLDIQIPFGITTNHTCQVYRSGFSASITSVPNDEMGLVFERAPTAGEITAESIIITDIVPEDLRGTTLYTSPSQFGIEQANEVPPLANDIAEYKDTLFYANTISKHRLKFNVISVGAPSGITVNDTITIAGITYTAAKGLQEITDVITISGGFITGGEYFTLLSARDQTLYHVFYIVDSIGSDPLPANSTAIQVDITSDDTDTVVATKTNTIIGALGDFISSVSGNTITITNSNTGITTNAADFDVGFTIAITQEGTIGENPATDTYEIFTINTPGANIEDTARSLVRVINRSSTNTTVSAFYLSSFDDFPGQILIEENDLGGSTFSITVSANGGAFTPTLPTTGTSISSSSDISPNGLFFSRKDQPESVPLTNFFFVGSKDKKIIRIVPLRESLFIFKEDGIFRLVGDTSVNFTIETFDTTTKLLASETAVSLSNQVYMWSDQGIVTVSETGVSQVSRTIEDKINEIIAVNETQVRQNAFAIAYETDRKYILFTPDNDDTQATQALVYNNFTETWTRWPIARSTGIIHEIQNKIFWADGNANRIYSERKTFTSDDFIDEDFDVTITLIVGGTNTATLNDASEAEVGDVLFQDFDNFSIITSISGNDVVVKNVLNLSSGSAKILKKYNVDIEWVPLTINQPFISKHYSEMVMFFKFNDFETADITFKSDISPTQETQTVLGGENQSGWGTKGWGEFDWGSSLAGVKPIRTYIPLEKQRCSQIILGFEHSVQLTHFGINGYALKIEPMNERITR